MNITLKRCLLYLPTKKCEEQLQINTNIKRDWYIDRGSKKHKTLNFNKKKKTDKIMYFKGMMRMIKRKMYFKEIMIT